eukprot:4983246-Amphidinium_carterae.1
MHYKDRQSSIHFTAKTEASSSGQVTSRCTWRFENIKRQEGNDRHQRLGTMLHACSAEEIEAISAVKTDIKKCHKWYDKKDQIRLAQEELTQQTKPCKYETCMRDHGEKTLRCTLQTLNVARTELNNIVRRRVTTAMPSRSGDNSTLSGLNNYVLIILYATNCRDTFQS